LSYERQCRNSLRHLGPRRRRADRPLAASGLNTIGQYAIVGAGTPPARDSS